MQAWSPFYWADYVADTAHLSLVEHGAYFMLMAHYYNTGKPLPANASILHRVCRAYTDTEQEAVAVVLTAYFQREGDVYRHKRIDRELTKSLKISQVRRDAANKRHLAIAGAKAVQEQVHLDTQSQSQLHKERSTTKATSAFVLPDWVPSEAWDHYEEMRRRIRKPMTDTARNWAVKLLAKLQKQGHSPTAVLEQSVFNSWQGLFEVRNDSNAQASGNDRQRPNTQVQRWNNNLRAAAVAVSEMDGDSGPISARQAPRLSAGSAEVVDQETRADRRRTGLSSSDVR